MKRLAAIATVFLFTFACSTAQKPPKTSAASLPANGSATLTGFAIHNGSNLPGTTVTLVASNGATRTAVTDANGHYVFAGVPAGTYTVRFELAGFNTTQRRVTVAAKAEGVNGEMRLASVAEAITVTAEAPLMRAGATMSMSMPAPAPPPVFRQTAANAQQSAYDATYALPQSERYATIQEHGFVDARKDATTTFSIDVDRASYSNVRRFLGRGQMPPADAVRLEEMVNYFSYSLPQPTGSDPFSITAEVSGCPWEPAHRLMRIGIQGRNLDEWKMAPTMSPARCSRPNGCR